MSHFRTSFVRPFEEHYSAISPWQPSLESLSSGDVFHLQELDASLYEDTEFYNDFILTHGDIDGGTIFKLVGQPGSFLILTIQYPRKLSERYDGILRRVLDFARGDLEEALDMASQRLQAWIDGACESALGVADAQGQSGFVIDQHRGLQRATLGAVDLLERQRGIYIRDGRMHLENPADDKWLSDSLRLLRWRKRKRSVGRTLRIGNSFRTAQLWRLPRPTIEVQSLVRDHYALILSDLQALDTNSGAHEVARHYGLSTSEVQVVTELAKDRSLSDIADRLQISIHTVRSHVKSAMRKTECHRQSELVAKVYRFSN